MPASHVKFHSFNGKRRILIADDEMINREILGSMLEAEYDTLFASDGPETLEMIRANAENLSAVLLDIMMPGMNGIEVLRTVRADEKTARIPVIVVTSEHGAEIESLHLGASDFISKPYPAVGVVQARVQRIIELSEDRQIIQSTERDELTGLYSREYFYRYAEQYDQFHRDAPMDALMIDVNHFHVLNERYGKAFGDKVLRIIADMARAAIQDGAGIVGRREADTFLIYCPHREDYNEILEKISAALAEEGAVGGSRVRLRMGVYADVEKTIDIERRFDRAKMASDSVRGSFTRNIGYYDNDLHEREIYTEQLIEDFPAAIQGRQFRVYYQPKFDVRPNTPILAGAEALVRWCHPDLGMISPGLFIPLFEENGLIRQLDNYVWRETARQIREWKLELGYSVPVSVNVSRIDMYDADVIDTLQSILEEYGIESADMHLEVTESAYTQDSEQIVDMVDRLRGMGFQIEMDDFGTGYSSLNMISSLPIDALKLDMRFIREAFKVGGNTHLLEIIIDIADYLSVPAIAEGVETEEQMDTLRSMGCDLVQGYFFSKPVPAAEFEAFILQKKEADKKPPERPAETARDKGPVRAVGFGKKHIDAMEPENAAEPEKTAAPEKERGGLHLKTANIFCVFLAFIAATALLIADLSVVRGYVRMQEASSRYISAQLAAADLESGSDYLTDRVRCFVVTGELEYLEDFFEEVNVTRRRDLAVENLAQLLEGSDSGALANLNTALELSNELVDTEDYAMRLTVEALGYDLGSIPAEIAATELTPEDLALYPEEKLEKARTLVFDNNYMHAKDKIRENVSLCTQSLIRTSSQELENASSRMAVLVNMQTALTILLLLIVLGIVIIISRQVRKPLSRMVRLMRNQELIPESGAEELRFVTRTYNQILEENRQVREQLSHEASHDALTGLFNRGAYDMLMESVDAEHMALILVDVDYFKSINDTYGHAVGDRVLKRVAETLQKSFRSVDIICRFGGDEFVVVMTRASSTMRALVLNKISRINDLLQHPKDGLPPVSLSVGVAFSDRENPQGDIFADADAALYRVKEAGRNGCAIFE